MTGAPVELISSTFPPPLFGPDPKFRTPHSAFPSPHSSLCTAGFTLLEVILSISILSIMGLMMFGSFSSMVDATTRAEDVMDELHVVEALTHRIGDSMRAATWYDSNPGRYEFRHEVGASTTDADIISWVTTQPPFRTDGLEGLVRVELTIEEVDGEDALVQRTWSSLWSENAPEIEDIEPVLITQRVKGLKVWSYDRQEQDWVDEWQRRRELPPSVILVLTLEPEEPGEPDREVTYRVDLPMAALSRATKKGQGSRASSSPQNEGASQNGTQEVNVPSNQGQAR